MAKFFDRLASSIIKYPKQIILAWVVILLCAAPFAIGAGEVLKYDTADVAMDDSESMRGLNIIEENFYQSEVSMSGSPILVLEADATGSLAGTYFQELSDAYLNDPGRLAEFKDADGNPKVVNFIYNGVSESDSSKSLAILFVVYSTEFTNVYDDTPELRNYVSQAVSEYESDKLAAPENQVVAITTYVTGSAAIGYDAEVAAMNDLAKIDPFTILLILVLVGLFFRSIISAATPPMTIGFAFGITLSLVFALGQIMNIYFITEMLILVTMMGAGCDYCIFILARYREERRYGKSHEESLRNSVVWAGESITTSGASVIIGFGALSLCSVPMVGTMGIILAVGILIALIAALTLITSMLSLAGDRMLWPSNAETFREGSKAMKGWYGRVSRFGANYFRKSAKFSQTHAKAIVAAAILVTVPAAYIAATAETSYDFTSTLSTGESYDGLQEIEGYVGGGFLMPNYVVVEFDDSCAVATLSYDTSGSQPTPLLIWNDNESYGKMVTLTDQITEIDNIRMSTSVAKWYDPSLANDSLLEEALQSWEIAMLTSMISAYPDEIREVLLAHGVAGVALMNMPTEASPYATVALTNMGMDIALLESMRTLISSGSFEDIENYIDTQPVMPSLSLAAMESPYAVPVMDAMINYMGGALGGDIAAGVGGQLTFAKVTAITVSSATSNESMDTIATIGGMVDTFKAENPEVASSWVTGSPAVMYDLSNSVGEEFNYIELVVVILIILLLFFVMKSYLIPIRSVLTIMMSIVWTLALTHLVFTNFLGIGVIWLIPIILFVVCLGLGMDYDILLTTRIKENVMHLGMDNDKAIYEAVTHTGSVITICGLIMGGAFGTLMLSSMSMMQEFGFALCFAILVDSLLVRTYIVPAVMHILGRWNWIGPKWMQRKIRAE
ncbi:MAG: putative drug exporter of the superfamily [Candidatus Methanomethylophilaceae archaeon]|nr:putative drug exporter of the superfamily [Candidatus Methanomethylophilaceae archaeon]